MTSAALVAEQFQHAAPLLEPVVQHAARGEFRVEDIERMTAEGRVVTGLAQDDDGKPVMAMAFEFVHYPRALGVNVLALGGTGLEEVARAFWQAFRVWCRDAGASFIEASCSEAMARLLARHGFESAYRVVRAQL